MVEADYNVPFLAHPTMEPMTAAAHLDVDLLQIWAGNQAPTLVLKVASEVIDLPVKQIEVHTPYMRGGFGRRAELDFVRHAILLAKELPGKPVLLTWTREDDTKHDVYQPAARIRARMQGATITALDVALAAPSAMASQMGRYGYPTPGPDPTIVQGAWESPYAPAAFRVKGYRAPPSVPLGFWQSVGASTPA